MALVTVSIRYGLLAFSGRIQLSPTLVRALGYVPPVVLTAIVVPAGVLSDGETLALGWQNARLVGAIASVALALCVVVRTREEFDHWQVVRSSLECKVARQGKVLYDRRQVPRKIDSEAIAL